MAEQERPYDAGDEAQVKKRRTKAELRREREKADWCEVLSTEAGMRLLWLILSKCGIHTDSFNANALVMANNEGRRKVGLFIELEIAEACPHKFLEMQLMAQKEETNG